MKIYNEDKTQILDNPDLKKGWLKQDQIVIKTIPATEEVQEQGHYVTIRKYPNGGEDVELVIDVPYQEAKPETYEYEDIQVYVPYTEEELKRNRTYEIQARLNELTQDFTQMQCGAVFEDADERVAEFQTLHNELRTLLGKEPREYK